MSTPSVAKLRLSAHLLYSLQVNVDDVCAICLEALKPKQSVLDLSCKHDFHKGCILKWLKTSEVT